MPCVNVLFDNERLTVDHEWWCWLYIHNLRHLVATWHVIIITRNWIIVGCKGQQHFQPTNKWHFIKLLLWIMILTIIRKPCCNMACHIIIMRDWVIVNCRGQRYIWLIHYFHVTNIINTNWIIKGCFTKKPRNFHIDYSHKTMMPHCINVICHYWNNYVSR